MASNAENVSICWCHHDIQHLSQPLNIYRPIQMVMHSVSTFVIVGEFTNSPFYQYFSGLLHDCQCTQAEGYRKYITWVPGARLIKTSDVLTYDNMITRKIQRFVKMHVLWYNASKFFVKFQRTPLKFHPKFCTHRSESMHFADFAFVCDLCLGIPSLDWYISSTEQNKTKQIICNRYIASAVVDLIWYSYIMINIEKSTFDWQRICTVSDCHMRKSSQLEELMTRAWWGGYNTYGKHNNDVIMSAMTTQITSLIIVYSTFKRAQKT